MPTLLSSTEQRVLLRNVSWETYERLLFEHEDSSSPRLTFDHGNLELMSPSVEHERYNLRIADLLGILADEMNLEVEGLGSATFKREDLRRGFEPDSCFYVENVERVRGRNRIDLEVDPPPDLVIEVEITHPSVSKLPILAEFKVPEVWCFNGEKLSILRLSQGVYQESTTSKVFPNVSAAALSELLAQGKSLTRTSWIRLARKWCHERYSQSSTETNT